MRRIIIAVVRTPILVALLLGVALAWGDAAPARAGDSAAPGAGAEMISAGGFNTCALKGGGAWCWGSNYSTADSLVPVAVSGLPSGVSAVGAGGIFNTCALKDGGVWCWDYRAVPMAVPGLTSGVAAISVGWTHTCALKDGGAWCWGDNTDGALGNNSETYSDVPVAVTGLAAHVSAISATGNSYTCALKDGGVWCWGFSAAGQLGSGTAIGPQTCLGLGGVPCSTTPVAVVGLASGVSAISAGWSHTCALKDGGVWCWGDNADGELGNSSTTPCNPLYRSPCSVVPVAVAGLAGGVSAISAGHNHTCALKDSGTWCWGYNDKGQLGNNSTLSSSVPVAVAALGSGVSAISAGYEHTCVLKHGGVWCWGANRRGQLGDNSTTDSPEPVEVQWPRLNALPPGGSGPSSNANEWILLGVAQLTMGGVAIGLGVRRRRRFRSVLS